MYTCFFMKNRHKYYYYFVFCHVGKKNDLFQEVLLSIHVLEKVLRL